MLVRPAASLLLPLSALVGPPPQPHARAAVRCCAFADEASYLESLKGITLPAGFSVGTTGFTFSPAELEGSSTAVMNLTLIALDEPTADYAAVFTRNRFPGAPVKVGKQRLADGAPLQAVVVNNKISNVCAAGGGIGDAEEVCTKAADVLGLAAGGRAVLPLSTGVIGWRLPVQDMLQALPSAADALQRGAALPAAESIMSAQPPRCPNAFSSLGHSLPVSARLSDESLTRVVARAPACLANSRLAATDRFPKLRSVAACGGSLVGFAKGAGMIEPDMATMLAFVLTDVAVPREQLQAMLRRAAGTSFNACSVDADQSTSDSLVCLSSGKVAAGEAELAAFEAALTGLCEALAEDVVRNGEGTTHVIRVAVRGAPDVELARGVGKAVVNSPLFKSAVAGNDPNVGRLVSTVGSYLGRAAPELPLEDCVMTMGGRVIFERGSFVIDAESEDFLHDHLKDAMLTGADGASLPYPPHQRCVEICVDLGAGDAELTVHGSDLTHEYVSINADYRS